MQQEVDCDDFSGGLNSPVPSNVTIDERFHANNAFSWKLNPTTLKFHNIDFPDRIFMYYSTMMIRKKTDESSALV